MNKIHPAKRIKKPVPVRYKRIIVFEKEGRFLITPREGKLLGGLYGFAEFEAGESVILYGHIVSAPFMPLGEIEQVYSHFRLQAQVCHVHYHEDITDLNGWYGLSEIAALPLSKADLKVLELLKTKVCS